MVSVKRCVGLGLAGLLFLGRGASAGFGQTAEPAADLKRCLVEIDRLKEEVRGLLITLQKREKLIAALEEDIKKYRTREIAARIVADQERIPNLLERIRLLEGALGEPFQPNPPLTLVKGTILRIDDKDRTLVELSVGTQHGVKKNHTLEVYRTKPRAEYLGMLRIIDSFNDKSVGKLVPSNLRRPPLQEGDHVAEASHPEFKKLFGK